MTTLPAARPGSWRDRAACRDSDLELFFPPEQLAPAARQELERQAVAVCGLCPVRQPCLQYSRVTQQGEGVWGGLTSALRWQR